MEGDSPDRLSFGSGANKSSSSPGGKSQPSLASGLKDFSRKFVDSEILTSKLQDWFHSLSENATSKKPAFEVPFNLTELQKFDYALEGVPFQQLIRMPSAIYASASDAAEATAYLAIEDFLHAGAKGLWETFWGLDKPMPLTVACLHSSSSKFYPAEKAISRWKLNGLCATALLLKSGRVSHSRWDQILELVLLRPDVGNLSMESTRRPSLPVIGEAIFFAIRVLLSRSLGKSNFSNKSSCVYVLLVDSQHGGVVRVEGDLSNLEVDVNRVYDCAADWLKKHSDVKVSPVDRIWNKLGNANWGDIGALQVLLATFHCMFQCIGKPKKSIEDLAAEHSFRLQKRRSEREFGSSKVNGNGSFRPHLRSYSPEIVEVDEDGSREPEGTTNLEVGSILWLEESNWQKGFQITEILVTGDHPVYVSTSLEEPRKSVLLYVGSHPSQLEPSWEDMTSWYRVQRQTKILSIMKQKGLSSKYLPELVGSGKIMHPGRCSGSRCEHPLCGTPVLVTSPIGQPLPALLSFGQFGQDDALKCCHNCLSVLHATTFVGIRHGDICPENVIRVSTKNPYYVLLGWGRAVLEERESPGPSLNLLFGSTFALQEGKLCPASDAESLIYLIYFCCGGVFPKLGSVEEALKWREKAWSKRLIQQKLGEVSPVLKAFADYVDSLCGTPYPVDYEIWLRRLGRSISGEEHGKEALISTANGRGESSGTSGS
ncbi:uncharacterized protein LOC18426184 isoform X1 [Amborella trichopoda]|uniref:Protein kinase domain-containing protein n=1 Tax=Amborella trichopoda TaxID=13333 RepID=W1NRL8_AMBTC|nr:uncharacterized protein LOC18426184 isoform X1 [Amborella trichopoda]ERM98183.1 hypothetical protein AMTR_s00095p00126700 [Amborella trichopoda]|eukprot:XP_006832905.1 uncharacterized protein LOC18426184 isoform X1 [Amborella trichopoda]